MSYFEENVFQISWPAIYRSTDPLTSRHVLQVALLLPTDTDCSSNCLSPKHRTFVLSRAQTVFHPNNDFCLISRSDCLSPKHHTFVLSGAQTVFHPNTTRLSYLALRLSPKQHTLSYFSFIQTPHFVSCADSNVC